jgi:PEP-CTERM/exosortase A-associated glycosyltransferase
MPTGAKQGESPANEEQAEGFRFYRTPAYGGRLATLPVADQLSVIAGLTKRLNHLIAQEKPTVVHAHSPALNGVAALRAARSAGLPVVYEMRASWEDAAVDHGSTTEGSARYRLSRALESWVLRRANAVTTISEGLRTDIISRGIAAADVTLIPNAVDMERFGVPQGRREAIRNELGLSGNTVLGFIGSFYAYEGLELLLEGLVRVRASNPSVKLLLVGGGFQETTLRESVARLGLSDAVVFTGRVPHNQVQGYYEAMDLLVYPRMSMRLTELVTPLKPLEAMAQDKIVVASDVGGHRELIRDGETGVLFEAGNASSLADVILNTLNSQNDWPSMKDRAKNFVKQERTWSAVCERYHGVYRRAIDSTG